MEATLQNDCLVSGYTLVSPSIQSLVTDGIWCGGESTDLGVRKGLKIVFGWLAGCKLDQTTSLLGLSLFVGFRERVNETSYIVMKTNETE